MAANQLLRTYQINFNLMVRIIKFYSIFNDQSDPMWIHGKKINHRVRNHDHPWLLERKKSLDLWRQYNKKKEGTFYDWFTDSSSAFHPICLCWRPFRHSKRRIYRSPRSQVDQERHARHRRLETSGRLIFRRLVVSIQPRWTGFHPTSQIFLEPLDDCNLVITFSTGALLINMNVHSGQFITR